MKRVEKECYSRNQYLFLKLLTFKLKINLLYRAHYVVIHFLDL